MSQERKYLSALFKRLHGMGIEAANMSACGNVDCTVCEPMDITETEVLQVLGEMMTADTGDITMSDVLAAAKRAGVY
jgi:hypothetical protein